MKKKKIIFGTVYYSSAKKYIGQFLGSLKNQTLKDFTLCIINDGAENLNAVLKPHKRDLKIIVVKPKRRLTQAELRGLLIRQAYKLKADVLVFGDIDDFFGKSRLEKTVKKIDGHAFVFNNIVLVDFRGKSYSRSLFIRKDLQKDIKDNKAILDKNMLGLSNTALNLPIANMQGIKIPKNIVAVDWWIFSKLLLNGNKGKYINDTASFYRQHDDNLVGGRGILNERLLDTGIKAKLAQYSYFSRLGGKDYSDRLKDIEKLMDFLKDKNNRHRYIKTINNKLANKKLAWWENIKTLKELETL